MNVAYNVGFIGVGNMGEAIVRGLKRRSPEVRIALFDANVAKTTPLEQQLGCVALADAQAVAANSEVIVLAVKPGGITPLLRELRGSLAHRPTIVSVAAGVSLEAMERAVGGEAVIVRSMPNTPCLVGQGVTAIAMGQGGDEARATAIRQVLSSVGLVVEVPETQLDAVTALSGSGPAYVFRFIEGLIGGGVALGLDVALATQLAIATVGGAAALAAEATDAPEVLRARVTSPGGTTAAGIKSFDSQGFVETIATAMRAAAARSVEMTAQYSAPDGDA